MNSTYPRTPWVKYIGFKKYDLGEEERDIRWFNVRVTRQRPDLYTTVCLLPGQKLLPKVKSVLKQWGIR
jgi:hypothetical protein